MAFKRLSAPRHYPVNRKQNTWVSSSRGSYQADYALPLVVILRDVLGYADTEKEVKQVLTEGKVLVDGKKRRDKNYPVGFMDVISLPDADEHYRVLIDRKGLKLKATEQPTTKWTKVKSKRKLKGDKVQLSLFNGSNLITDNNQIKPGSTLEVTLPDKEIKDIIEFEEGNQAYIIKGRHVGEIKTIKKIKKSQVIFEEDGASTVPEHIYPLPADLNLEATN